MSRWRFHAIIKHLLTEEKDLKSIQASMNAIADVLQSKSYFNNFNLSDFRNIPARDNFFGPADYANKLLERMYDYADENDIWIE